MEFFEKHKHLVPGNNLCLELLGGMGRITIALLKLLFKSNHMNELVKENCSQAKEKVCKWKKKDWLPGKIMKTFCCDVMSLKLPNEYSYDCIWSCWCFGYLKHFDILTLLKKCRETLCKNNHKVHSESCLSNIKRLEKCSCNF